jgi:hypothetical protein
MVNLPSFFLSFSYSLFSIGFLNSVKDTNLDSVMADAKNEQQAGFVQAFMEVKDKIVESGKIFPSLGMFEFLFVSFLFLLTILFLHRPDPNFSKRI